jgi:hypothetical protein
MYWIAVYLDGLLKGRWSRKISGEISGEVEASGQDTLLWDAVVLEKRGNNTALVIPELALETQVATRKQKDPNELVKLRLVRVRVPEGEAAFEQLI